MLKHTGTKKDRYQAYALHAAWDMANLLYPEQRDLINNPVNVHAVKVKRAMIEEQNAHKIKELAKNFDLVLFFSDSCKYCALLSPVLKNFSEDYGFSVDAVSSTRVGAGMSTLRLQAGAQHPLGARSAR